MHVVTVAPVHVERGRKWGNTVPFPSALSPFLSAQPEILYAIGSSMGTILSIRLKLIILPQTPILE